MVAPENLDLVVQVRILTGQCFDSPLRGSLSTSCFSEPCKGEEKHPERLRSEATKESKDVRFLFDYFGCG